MKKSRDKIEFVSSDPLENDELTPSEAETAGENIIMGAFAGNDHEEYNNEAKTPEFIAAVNANTEKMAMLIMAGEFEKLEIAFDNAGVGATYTGIYDMAGALHDREIALNFTGQFYCIKYELQQFLEQAGSNM